MTPARRRGWAEAVFRAYLGRLFRRSFASVRVRGTPPSLPPGLPVLLVANHSTWWDGFLLHRLNADLLRRTLYMMMLEDQLARFPFFRLVGAFGMPQGRPRGVRDSLAYATALLSRPDTLLCIFPQGVLGPWRQRPLGFRRGIERILSAHDGSVAILPVALRCEFLGDRLPTAFMLPGEPAVVSGTDFKGTGWLEAQVHALLDRLDGTVQQAGTPPQAGG
jgi:1-acyl-sn-glycerol-3-phosphate acyltransferase